MTSYYYDQQLAPPPQAYPPPAQPQYPPPSYAAAPPQPQAAGYPAKDGGAMGVQQAPGETQSRGMASGEDAALLCVAAASLICASETN